MAACQEQHDGIVASEKLAAAEDVEGWRPKDKIAVLWGASLPGSKVDFSGEINIIYAEHPQDEYRLWFDVLPDKLEEGMIPKCRPLAVAVDTEIGTVDELVKEFRRKLTIAVETQLSPKAENYKEVRAAQDSLNERVGAGEPVLVRGLGKHSHPGSLGALYRFQQHRDKVTECMKAAPE